MAVTYVSLSNACRLCLKIDPANVPVWSRNEKKPTLAQKIWKYFSVWVEKEDIYPRNICPQCLKEIEHFSAFAIEVDKIQKRLRTIFLSRSSSDASKSEPQGKPTEEKSVPRGNLIEDLMKEYVSSEKDPLDIEEIVATNCNRGIKLQFERTYEKVISVNDAIGQTQFVVPGGNITTAQTQIYNPNQVQQFVVVGGGSPVIHNKNAALQTQCYNSSQKKQILFMDTNTGTVNKQNLNMQTQLQNSRQTTPPFFLISGQNEVNKLSAQTQPKMPPVFIVDDDSPPQNKGKLQSRQNRNQVMSYIIVGGSSGIQNEPRQLAVFNNNSILQNHINTLNPNQATQFEVITPDVQNINLNAQNQVGPILVTSDKESVQNKANLVSILKQHPMPVGPVFQDRRVNNENTRQSAEFHSAKTQSVKDKKASTENTGLLSETISTETPSVQGDNVSSENTRMLSEVSSIKTQSAEHSKVGNEIITLLLEANSTETQSSDNKISSENTRLLSEANSIEKQYVEHRKIDSENTRLLSEANSVETQSVEHRKDNNENIRRLLETNSADTQSVQDNNASIENIILMSEDSPRETESNANDVLETKLQKDNLDSRSDITDDGIYYYESDPNDKPQELSQHDLDMAAFYDFTCAYCKEEKKSFKKYELLEKHCLIEHERQVVIECCGRKLTGEYTLSRHMKKHTQRTKCPKCGKQLSGTYSLRMHMMLHLPNEQRPYICKECGRGFPAKMHLRMHETTHLSDKERLIHVCHICGKRFSTAISRRSHEQYYHQRVRKAMCHLCPKTFATRSALQRHLEAHNITGRISEKCPKCGKLLKNKGTLKNHMILHDDKQSFPCPHCSKVFTIAARLRSHLQCHQEWRHQCVVCKKKFKRKTGFEAHMVIHSGDKPFHCPHCTRTFASKSNYYTHILRMHSGALQPDDVTEVICIGRKQFQCPHCPRIFTNKSNCLIHNLRRHKRKKGDVPNSVADKNDHPMTDGTHNTAEKNKHDGIDKSNDQHVGDDGNSTSDDNKRCVVDDDRINQSNGGKNKYSVVNDDANKLDGNKNEQHVGHDGNSSSDDGNEHSVGDDDIDNTLTDDTNDVADEKEDEIGKFMEIEIKNEVIDEYESESGNIYMDACHD